VDRLIAGLSLLAPRAEDSEVSAVTPRYIGRVRALVGSVGRRESAPAWGPELRDQLNEIARACGARPVAQGVDLPGRVARMVDPAWWRRNLRTQLLRKNEAQEQGAAYVRKRHQCYVSDHAMKRKAARAKANRATLERLEVANEDGQAFSLAKVSDGSISNPKLRRSELMVRCRGFEEIATFHDHEAVLLTMTLPSRFHRFNSNGDANPKWTTETTRAGVDYLNALNKRIGAQLGKFGLTPYGFRVAEPHHDGCPHWHILLFAPREQMGFFNAKKFAAGEENSGAGIIGVYGAYTLEESPNERGAVKARFTAKRIDPSKGGATGYIAKYISKNIDGKREDGSEMGVDFDSATAASKGAQRVRTWAQTWGIRQFQQIGGPSVTVWRELRRLGKGDMAQELEEAHFEGPRVAADGSRWAQFWLAQGGPDNNGGVRLRPLYETKRDAGKYGDAVKRVVGVTAAMPAEKFAALMDAEPDAVAALVAPYQLRTRTQEWVVQLAGLAEVNRHWDNFHGDDAEFYKAYESIESQSDFEGREATPWTGVNNSTDPDQSDEAAAIYADFLRSMQAEAADPPPGRPPGNSEKET
jgi:hypothetical protein